MPSAPRARARNRRSGVSKRPTIRGSGMFCEAVWRANRLMARNARSVWFMPAIGRIRLPVSTRRIEKTACATIDAAGVLYFGCTRAALLKKRPSRAIAK